MNYIDHSTLQDLWTNIRVKMERSRRKSSCMMTNCRDKICLDDDDDDDEDKNDSNLLYKQKMSNYLCICI